MFDKLLSRLPYNPELAEQVRFYGQRMRQETAIRRTGLIFLVLTFMVQFFAVISPAQPTAASSTNDLVTGGITSAEDAHDQCENNTRGYQVILHYYGISCDAFTGAATVIIHNGAEDYYTMGHNPTGSDGEVSVAVCNASYDCAGTMYWRHLSVWPEPSEGPGGSKGWKTLRLRNQDNKLFYVMFDCGNLVSIGVPGSSPLTTPTPTPTPKPTPTPTPSPKPTPTPTPTPAPTPTPTPAPAPPASHLPEACPYNPAVARNSVLCYPPCPYNGTLSATDVECKPCDKSVNSQDRLACVEVSKTAANLTQKLSDANNTTAQPGDVIIYTLYAKNAGKANVTDYTFQENLNDVLDYATVTDLHGGTMDSGGIVSWPKTGIKAGRSASVQITVQVKNPIPDTPVSTTDPAHFDLVMTNVYGNTINIKVPSPPIKTVQAAAATLPNTGPGSSLFIAALIVIAAGYFYSRARLLSQESELALQESSGA